MSADADRIGSATADLMANITDELHDISLRPVGHGGYSEIYTGVWRSTFGSMKVAIKVIRAAPRPRSTNELPRVLRREIAVWKRLLHPNIHFLCGFYEGFGSVPALVSPWYENGDINDYVRLRAADSNIGPTKLKLFADVVTGLQFLHENHIVHGDIKGGNVLVSSTGVARLCDFGLSRLLLEHSQSTTSTGGKGTVRWMAPELLLVDGARHSYASDIWACGCMFIEVWSNVLPYHDKTNNHQVLIALSRHEPPIRPDDMPDLMWSLVHDCCVSEAADRASPSSLLHMIHISLVSLAMERVRKMVQLDRLPEIVETYLLAEIATSLREADLHGVADLYELSDIELATAVVRYYSVWGISRSRLFQNPLFKWCLAKIGIDELLLPTEHANEYVMDAVNPAELRPFARLVAQVHPGMEKRFMTKFAEGAHGRSFATDAAVRSVAWIRDGNSIVVGCKDGIIRVLGVTTGATLLRLVGHTNDINQVHVSPIGRLLASCSDDKSIRLWSAETGLAIGAPMVGHTASVRSVAFSPDGRHIVSGSSDDTIRVWSTETCTTVLGPLHGHPSPVTSVSYSPDGCRIVSGSWDNTVRVWNAAGTGDVILTLRGHTSLVHSVAYSPDGLRIVSGSADHTARVWNATTGQQVGSPLEGHSHWLRSVAYSPAGTRIASSSGGQGIHVWDATTGDFITTIRGHTYTVLCVAFSPDGKQLAAASGDCTVRIWDATDNWRHWDM